MKFWLGIHRVAWLERTAAPTMVSFRWLVTRKTLPRALGPWVQDSGGFTEVQLHGAYATSAAAYARRTRLHFWQVGHLRWAAVQDWMCGDVMLARTGLSVMQHQQKTVESYLDLCELAPDLPWLPVLQGQTLDDYRRHVDLYMRHGVDLHALPLVGLGTVARRQHTMVVVRIIQGLAELGLRLHGFGLKITSLVRAQEWLSSGDSMAWSLDGRYSSGGRCSPHRTHKACNNCLEYALLWRQRLIDKLTLQPRMLG